MVLQKREDGSKQDLLIRPNSVIFRIDPSEGGSGCRQGSARYGASACRRRRRRIGDSFMKVDWTRHLVSDPGICNGRIRAKGTRVPVRVILDSLAEGASRDDVLQSYPTLKPEHIEAALAYAAELVRDEETVPLRGRS